MNEATQRQMYGLILISCLEQTNAEVHRDQASYEIALKARLRERLSKDGQRELPV